MNRDLSPDDTSHGKHDYLFPLELVANVAVRVLLARKDFQKRPSYDDAVDVALRLLRACQSRLDDESTQAKDRSAEDWEGSLRQIRHEREQLEQKYGNPVPFLKGLLYITQKRSETEALPHYTRWLLYYVGTVYSEAESRQFFGQPKPPRPTQANLELELKRQRREGFHPVTLTCYREDYAKWHLEVDLPERKRRPKSKKSG